MHFKLMCSICTYFQYRSPIGKVVVKYNGLWFERIRPICTKTENSGVCNSIKNNTPAGNLQNRNVESTLRATKESNMLSTGGFKHSPFHQIHHQNGRMPSEYAFNGGLSLDHNMPQNYRLSTLSQHSKVCLVNFYY